MMGINKSVCRSRVKGGGGGGGESHSSKPAMSNVT